MAKSRQAAQVPVYPYYIPAVPTVIPLAPSSHMDPKISTLTSTENNLAGGVSEVDLKTPQGNTYTPIYVFYSKHQNTDFDFITKMSSVFVN